MFIGRAALLINHATITGLNQAESAGVRVHGTSGSVTVQHSIIANSEVGIRQQLRSFVHEGNKLFYDNAPDPKGAMRQIAGRIAGDPAFVVVGADDYHIGDGSAAVDAAGASALTTDFEGDARPQGADTGRRVT